MYHRLLDDVNNKYNVITHYTKTICHSSYIM